MSKDDPVNVVDKFIEEAKACATVAELEAHRKAYRAIHESMFKSAPAEAGRLLAAYGDIGAMLDLAERARERAERDDALLELMRQPGLAELCDLGLVGDEEAIVFVVDRAKGMAPFADAAKDNIAARRVRDVLAISLSDYREWYEAECLGLCGTWFAKNNPEPHTFAVAITRSATSIAPMCGTCAAGKSVHAIAEMACKRFAAARVVDTATA
jgi:hypothetical protein